MNKSARVAALGECMLEVSRRSSATGSAATPPPLEAALAFGGDTLNTAIYLSRLGVQADYFTGLGDDSMSEWMLSQWRRDGVGCDEVWRERGGVPGLYLVSVDRQGERSFLYWRENSPARRLFDDVRRAERIFGQLAAYPYLYLSGISLALYDPEPRSRLFTFIAEYRRSGGHVVFDGNYRPAQWPDQRAALSTYEAIYRLADIALPTLEDEQLLFGDPDEASVIHRLTRLGVEEIALKKGPEGSIVVAGGDTTAVSLGSVHRVIDTTAAGDSFNAGYLSARFSGVIPAESARAGHHLASAVVQHPGAIIPRSAMPSPPLP